MKKRKKNRPGRSLLSVLVGLIKRAIEIRLQQIRGKITPTMEQKVVLLEMVVRVVLRKVRIRIEPRNFGLKKVDCVIVRVNFRQSRRILDRRCREYSLLEVRNN